MGGHLGGDHGRLDQHDWQHVRAIEWALPHRGPVDVRGLAFGAREPTITLPFAVGFLASRQLTFAMYDNAGVQYPGTHAGAVAGGSVVPLYSIDASVARAANAAITTSSPFSVGSGDVWELTGEFRMNSRYS